MENMEQTTTVIRKCGCVSLYQDRIYGMRLRVHNSVNGNGTRPGDARCTVCGTIHGPVKIEAKVSSTATKVTGIARMGGKKAGKKCKKKN